MRYTGKVMRYLQARQCYLNKKSIPRLPFKDCVITERFNPAYINYLLVTKVSGVRKFVISSYFLASFFSCPDNFALTVHREEKQSSCQNFFKLIPVESRRCSPCFEFTLTGER